MRSFRGKPCSSRVTCASLCSYGNRGNGAVLRSSDVMVHRGNPNPNLKLRPNRRPPVSPPVWKGRRTQWMRSFRGRPCSSRVTCASLCSYGNRGNGAVLRSSDVVYRGNPNPNRLSGLHGESARGDGNPLSRLSAADHFAPKARHQKRGNPVRISPFLASYANLDTDAPQSKVGCIFAGGVHPIIETLI